MILICESNQEAQSQQVRQAPLLTCRIQLQNDSAQNSVKQVKQRNSLNSPKVN